MVSVDQLRRDWRRLRQQPEPAGRVDAFECFDGIAGDVPPGDAVETVTAGNKIAGDLVRSTVLDVTNARAIAVEIMQTDVGGVIDRDEAGLLASGHQVARDFGLSVDGDCHAVRGVVQVYAVAYAATSPSGTVDE